MIFEFFLKIGVFFGKFLYDLFVHLGLLVTSQVPIGIFDEFCVLCAMQVGFVFREPGKYAKQFDRDQWKLPYHVVKTPFGIIYRLLNEFQFSFCFDSI